MSEWAIATLPLVGVVLGAALHSRFARLAHQEEQQDSLRAEAYTDYLRAVAASGHLRSDEDLRDADRDAADAKARIAVFGSSPVIKALARFEREGAALSNPDAADAFVDMVTKMRSESGVVSEDDLRLLLFGPEAGA